MRLKALISMGVAALGIAFTAAPAAAFDWNRSHPPAGWGTDRVVKHWVYYPRYHNLYQVHGGTDPYAYRSARRGYYPYQGSAYWRSHSHVRPTHLGHPPAYHPAWGRGHALRHTYKSDTGHGHGQGQGHVAPWHW